MYLSNKEGIITNKTLGRRDFIKDFISLLAG
jgi:hypothetical protein